MTNGGRGGLLRPSAATRIGGEGLGAGIIRFDRTASLCYISPKPFCFQPASRWQH